jgi:hypothetical protein
MKGILGSERPGPPMCDIPNLSRLFAAGTQGIVSHVAS